MDIAAFYLLASVVTLSAICVITAKNPVHSVLFLILCFFTSAGLLVLIGAEFLAMLLVVVYVGAVAVLFLFVVMMLDVDFVELKQGTLRYWPFASLVGIVLAAEIMLVSVAPGGAAPQIVSRVQATALEGQTLAYLAEAVDRDGDAVTFALEGRDADQFAFDPDSADKIVFKAPVDRAFPADENKDNVYDVTLVASDGDQSTQHALTIRVVGPAERLTGT
ncbi:MAG: NADH-quinone oxidoreductase subunit J, partial [Pseudomonadota bacterium]